MAIRPVLSMICDHKSDRFAFENINWQLQWKRPEQNIHTFACRNQYVYTGIGHPEHRTS